MSFNQSLTEAFHFLHFKAFPIGLPDFESNKTQLVVADYFAIGSCDFKYPLLLISFLFLYFHNSFIYFFTHFYWFQTLVVQNTSISFISHSSKKHRNSIKKLHLFYKETDPQHFTIVTLENEAFIRKRRGSFLLFLSLTSLLSYNPHTIQFTHLGNTTPCFSCILRVAQPSAHALTFFLGFRVYKVSSVPGWNSKSKHLGSTYYFRGTMLSASQVLANGVLMSSRHFRGEKTEAQRFGNLPGDM